MSHAHLPISKRPLFIGLILSLTALLFSGCATSPDDVGESAEPLQRVFIESFDSVWKAVQMALVEYPLRVSNQDGGIVETDFIRGDQVWQTPGSDKPVPGGLRYKINVAVFVVSVKGNDSASKVVVSKSVELQRDFFSNFEKIGSDGLEERALMYRITRELKLRHLIDAAAKQKQKLDL